MEITLAYTFLLTLTIWIIYAPEFIITPGFFINGFPNRSNVNFKKHTLVVEFYICNCDIFQFSEKFQNKGFKTIIQKGGLS
jgi:hypothetical protein